MRLRGWRNTPLRWWECELLVEALLDDETLIR